MRWATRLNCHVDRAACAWLIRRFLDSEAEFVFVEDPDEVPDDATAFDIPGVDLSHHGGECSFETFLRRYELADPILWDIAKIVHEADLEDERYGTSEAPGLDVLIRGLSLISDDSELLRLSAPLFDGLYEYNDRHSCSGESRPERHKEKEAAMKWVTRERPKTDRIACPWLIAKFIDPKAEFLYVPADQVLEVAEREEALSYDAADARYTHRDGLCSFEVLVEEYELDDPALALLARIVHGADVAEDRDATPQSRGLLAVAEGFHLMELGDHRQLELSVPVYDALYEWCRHEVASSRPA